VARSNGSGPQDAEAGPASGASMCEGIAAAAAEGIDQPPARQVAQGARFGRHQSVELDALPRRAGV